MVFHLNKILFLHIVSEKLLLSDLAVKNPVISHKNQNFSDGVSKTEPEIKLVYGKLAPSSSKGSASVIADISMSFKASWVGLDSHSDMMLKTSDRHVKRRVDIVCSFD